jgi:hypothetical protein
VRSYPIASSRAHDSGRPSSVMKKMGIALGVALLASACVLETGEPTSIDEGELVAANKLAANKLAANKLAANKLAANKLAASSLQTKALMDTADGREVMSFIVSCALPAGQNLTLTTTAGTPYTYPGSLNLAPAWATRVPTIAERHWVTACLLARTNLYGVSVSISMRHDTSIPLAATMAEKTTYTRPEGSFYGDLFAPTPLMYACSARAWSQAAFNSFRACALSSNGSTTDCGFTYTGSCNPTACSDNVAPFSTCSGGGVSYPEAITIFLTSSQQGGSTQ